MEKMASMLEEAQNRAEIAENKVRVLTTFYNFIMAQSFHNPLFFPFQGFSCVWKFFKKSQFKKGFGHSQNIS